METRNPLIPEWYFEKYFLRKQFPNRKKIKQHYLLKDKQKNVQQLGSGSKIPLHINKTDSHRAIKNDNYSYKRMPILNTVTQRTACPSIISESIHTHTHTHTHTCVCAYLSIYVCVIYVKIIEFGVT